MNINEAAKILEGRIGVTNYDHAYKKALEIAVSVLKRQSFDIGDRVKYYDCYIGRILHPDYMDDSVVVLSENFPLCPQVVEKSAVVKTDEQNNEIAKSLKKVLKDLFEKNYDGNFDY